MSYNIEFIGGNSLVWSADMIANTVTLNWKMFQPTTETESNIESTDTGALAGTSYQRAIFNINFQKFWLRTEVIDSQDKDLYYNLVNLAAQRYLWIKSVGTDSVRFADLATAEAAALHSGSTAISVTNINSDATNCVLSVASHGLTTGDFVNLKDVTSATITITDGQYQIETVTGGAYSITFSAAVANEVAISGTSVKTGTGSSNWLLPIRIKIPDFPKLEFAEGLGADDFALTAKSKGLFIPTIFG